MTLHRVLKVGGAELQDGPVLDELCHAIEALVAVGPLVIVHGGGNDIPELLRRLALVPTFVDGLRVTDDASMWVAEMVLSGSVNKRLTARLVSRGVHAIGLSGVDSGLLRAECLVHPKGNLGRVGTVTRVEPRCLLDLLDHGFTPVVSPISLGNDGRPFNVNADHAALAIAKALGADEMIFLTDVPGVLNNGEVITRLTPAEAKGLIVNETISGGMIPKVRSALEALADGVGRVRITNLDGLQDNSGTCVVGANQGGVTEG